MNNVVFVILIMKSLLIFFLYACHNFPSSPSFANEIHGFISSSSSFAFPLWVTLVVRARGC